MLTEGDIIEIKEGHKIEAEVPEHFCYSNQKGNFKLIHNSITVGGELSYFIGRYIVTKTYHKGDRAGHGPNDTYPGGHCVCCVKVNDKKVKITFYQNGCFRSMITDIKPIGKAKLTWTIGEDKKN